MRDVDFTEAVRAYAHKAAAVRGYGPDIVEGVLAAISYDIARTFDKLTLRPPDHPDRRTYFSTGEDPIGLVQAICEQRDERVVVIRLQIEAFE